MTRTLRLVTTLGAAALLGAGATARAEERFPFEAARGRIRAAVDTREVPAFAVAVARRGEVLWEEGFGLADPGAGTPATPHTMFSLASVSKPLTATALMLLVERGAMDLDAPVSDYLGRARLQARAGAVEEATVRRVASHTAGLPLHHHFFPRSGPRPPPLAETIRRYGNLFTRPGEEFQYSNLGYTVLEHALETVSGRRYAGFMRDEVFLPLGMTRTAVLLDPETETRPLAVRHDRDGEPIPFYDFDHRAASAVYASARDLLGFGMFHVGTPLPGQEPILSRRALERMRRAEADMPGGRSYGLGWIAYDDERGERIVEHGGGMPGVSALLRLVPTRGIAVVALASAESDLPRQVAEDVIAELVPRRPGFGPARASAGRRGTRRSKDGDPHPPRGFRGTWVGSVHTYQGPVPLRLILDGRSAPRVALDGRPTAPLLGIAFDDERLTGLARERLGTADTRTAPLLRFSLSRRGDALSGSTTALASGAGALPLALSHWTALKRERSDPSPAE